MGRQRAFILAQVTQALPGQARKATVTLADGSTVSTVVDRRQVVRSGGESRLEVTCYRCNPYACEVRIPGAVEDGRWPKVTIAGQSMCRATVVA